MVGRFPTDQLWRPWAAAYVLAATLGLCIGVIAAVAAADPRRRHRPGASPSTGAVGAVRAAALLAPGAVRGGDPVAHPDGPARRAARRPRRPRSVATRAVGRRLPGLARWLWVIVAVGGPRSRSSSSSPPAAWAGTTGAGCSSRCSSPWSGSCSRSRSACSPRSAADRAFRSSGSSRSATSSCSEPCRSSPSSSSASTSCIYAVPDLRRPAQLPRPGAGRHRAVRERLHRRDRAGRAAVDPRAAARGGAGARASARCRRCAASCCPQALRNVIPAIVGQFISLFKDTSLLAIVGFFEVLDVARSVPASRTSSARACPRSPWRSPGSSTGWGRTPCRGRAGASSADRSGHTMTEPDAHDLTDAATVAGGTGEPMITVRGRGEVVRRLRRAQGDRPRRRVARRSSS